MATGEAGAVEAATDPREAEGGRKGEEKVDTPVTTTTTRGRTTTVTGVTVTDTTTTTIKGYDCPLDITCTYC